MAQAVWGPQLPSQSRGRPEEMGQGGHPFPAGQSRPSWPTRGTTGLAQTPALGPGTLDTPRLPRPGPAGPPGLLGAGAPWTLCPGHPAVPAGHRQRPLSAAPGPGAAPAAPSPAELRPLQPRGGGGGGRVWAPGGPGSSAGATSRGSARGAGSPCRSTEDTSADLPACAPTTHRPAAPAASRRPPRLCPGPPRRPRPPSLSSCGHTPAEPEASVPAPPPARAVPAGAPRPPLRPEAPRGPARAGAGAARPESAAPAVPVGPP